MCGASGNLWSKQNISFWASAKTCECKVFLHLILNQINKGFRAGFWYKLFKMELLPILYENGVSCCYLFYTSNFRVFISRIRCPKIWWWGVCEGFPYHLLGIHIINICIRHCKVWGKTLPNEPFDAPWREAWHEDVYKSKHNNKTL